MNVKGDLLTFFELFLFKRQQRIVLNGQESDSQTPGVPDGSVIRSIILLIYITNLSGNLEAKVKLLADDTPMCSVISDHINTSQKVNKCLNKVGIWINKWKICFNPDLLRQAQ